MEQAIKKEEKYPETAWTKLQNEWKIFISVLGRPNISIPLVLCGAALYFANTIYEQPSSLVLSIAATILAGIASGGIWDSIKNIMGNTLLIKKGNSAVRNLSSARLKIKNISERAKGKASTEEIGNLLSWLEKDIANSIQEWNDILPGVANIETIYALLGEKEAALEVTMSEKEELNILI